jgi:hypothetical protein
MMMPAKLSKVTKVKNFRYVLNHNWKRIHLLALFFGADGFFAAGGFSADSMRGDGEFIEVKRGFDAVGVIPS